MASILIIDDEPVLAHQLEVVLGGSGHTASTASTASEGLESAAANPPDLVLLDLRLPDGSGLELIPKLLALDPGVQIVLMTAYGSVRDAVEAIRRGAADYLQKPLDLGELGILIDRLQNAQRARRELDYHRERDRGLPRTAVRNDPGLAEVIDRVERFCDPGLRAGQRPPILLIGEEGTGRALIARTLHESLGGGPFLEVRARGAQTETLDRNLFGQERGEGAPASRPGLFEAAEGGTLLIQQVDALALPQQERLLEVLASRQVRRSGSSRGRPVDVHLIATAERPLDDAVARGGFLEQLHARLSLLAFEIPPLRERPEDIRALAAHFAERLGQQYGGVPRALSEEAHALLHSYEWPGNVSELRTVIERAVLLNDEETLSEPHLGPLIKGAVGAVPGRVVLPADGLDLEQVERDLLRQALQRAGGNQTRASALLGLSRDTLRYRISKFGLQDAAP